jgi:hypothetical protein
MAQPRSNVHGTTVPPFLTYQPLAPAHAIVDLISTALFYEHLKGVPRYPGRTHFRRA